MHMYNATIRIDMQNESKMFAHTYLVLVLVHHEHLQYYITTIRHVTLHVVHAYYALPNSLQQAVKVKYDS